MRFEPRAAATHASATKATPKAASGWPEMPTFTEMRMHPSAAAASANVQRLNAPASWALAGVGTLGDGAAAERGDGAAAERGDAGEDRVGRSE